MDLLGWDVPKDLEVYLYTVRLPLKKSLVTSFGAPDSYKVFVVMKKERHFGIGEAPVDLMPFYSEETVDTVRSFVKSVIKEVVGKNLFHVYKAFERYRGNYMAKAALEASILTLYSSLKGIDLMETINGREVRIPVQESVGITNSLEELSEWVEEALDWGARRIKLKIKPNWDMEPVRFVSYNYPGIPIIVDANGGYDPLNEGHWERLLKISSMVEGIEQPFPPNDIFYSIKLGKEGGVKIIFDESVRSHREASAAIELGESMGVKVVINIKPPRVGGLFESVKIVGISNERRTPVFIGGLLETSVGRYINMLVASVTNYLEPSDFSPDTDYYEDSIVDDPFSINCGFVKVRHGPGIPFKVNFEKLRKYSVAVERIL